MRNVYLTAAVTLALLLAQGARAQTNVQVFYDFGSDRQYVTTTLEGFYGDKWGNTFFFIDHDYNYVVDNLIVSPNGTYFEIARCLNFWGDTAMAPLSLQVEYNGGFGTGGNMAFAFPVNSAFLVGLDYFLHSGDFNNTLNLKLLYKGFVGLPCKVPLQFTAVWGCQDLFGASGLRFSGFVDVWCEYDHAVVLSEPQLWYNFGTEHFNLGGEVEFSYNFAGMEGFHVMPCIGTKWVF